MFGDTETQQGCTCHISFLHFLQICLFSDRGQEPGHDVQVVYLIMCGYEDELWDCSLNAGHAEKEFSPASGSHELGMV